MSAVQWRLAGVWVTLVALLALTVGASFVLTGTASIVVSLGIAFAKTTLIFWFFMQLRSEQGLIRVFAVGAGVWLLILFGLATIDYATR